MNVLFVASDNNYTSGAFLSMVKLNQLLVSEHQVNTFVVLPNEGDGEQLLETAGILFEIVPSRNWIVDIEEGKTEQREIEKEAELKENESAVERICELIHKKKIDILHINTSYSYVGAVAALRMKIPFVWHIREFLEEDQNRKIWNREKGYQLMSQANAIVAISDSIYKKYSKILPIEKLYTIYNGIDEKQFYNPHKQIFKDDIVKLGIVGGVVPHKGQEELLRACVLLKRRGFDKFELRIVGKGKDSYKDFLMQIVKNNNLQENVVFLGPRNDISEVLKEIDILCVCSRNEAFGRITVEGMMAGCVVVGADTSGTTEILENGRTGYLYEHGNETDLAKQIAYVLEDKERSKRIRTNGQEKALLEYTATQNAMRVNKLYQDTKGTL